MDGSRSRKSGPINNAPTRTGSFGGATSHSGQLNSVSRGSVSAGGVSGSASLKKTNSGPLNKHGEPIKKSSGPQGGGTAVSRQNSGPLPPVLPTTGLITSGPITSGPLNSSGAPRKASGPLESTGSMKLHSASIVNNQAVTHLSQDDEYSFRKSFPKPILWAIILLFVMGFIAGGFILGAVRNPILLVVVVVLFAVVATVFTWNTCWGRRAITGFIASYPDAELRTAKDGQFVKVSGVCPDFKIHLFTSPVQILLKTPSTSTTNKPKWGFQIMEIVNHFIQCFWIMSMGSHDKNNMLPLFFQVTLGYICILYIGNSFYDTFRSRG